MTVRAMKAGAVEFLTPNPSVTRIFWMRIHLALEKDRADANKRWSYAALRERFELLSPREREVVRLWSSQAC